MKENRTSFNYLIQHSAGSGKTYTICCLAHQLASLHDEAHSSTAGKDMAAVTKTLGSDDGDEEKDVIDMYEDDIKSHQKPDNVSMFAFTATPKPKTLVLFGRKNEKGQEEAFHLYSMKQAIEEGFILKKQRENLKSLNIKRRKNSTFY